MTRIKTSEKDTKTAEKTAEKIPEPGTAISAKPAEITPGQTKEAIEETPMEELPNIGTPEPVEGSTEGVTGQEEAAPSQDIEATAADCEILYGVVMETAHGIIGNKKGFGHRELPEDRRKAQGALMYSICQRYNITIPTEFELVILGGAIIADWQYMTVKKDTTEQGGESVGTEINDSVKE